MMGDDRCLSALLRRGENGVYIEDDINGWTPVHYASFYGQLECLMILHSHGTHHDSPTIRLRQTPAHMASLSGKISCLKWLLGLGIAINREDYLSETVLHKVARGGNTECAMFLISQGADRSLRNSAGLTPAELAANMNHQECFMVLDQCDTDVNDIYMERDFQSRKRKKYTDFLYTGFNEFIKRSKIDLPSDNSNPSQLDSFNRVLLPSDNKDLWEERDDFGAVFF
ncbi:DgyrCDS3382 [Dimorphilus gyrociliatus]|uniref:DgyrCDS3382 n=1 Tax=Dimorphilus gyrociliatus TaxID=2664684 RepID=A0A7I8VE51_9ANNE|nr:DgyrCDS3382 [Dimorphilus gyrociliatus]